MIQSGLARERAVLASWTQAMRQQKRGWYQPRQTLWPLLPKRRPPPKQRSLARPNRVASLGRRTTDRSRNAKLSPVVVGRGLGWRASVAVECLSTIMSPVARCRQRRATQTLASRHRGHTSGVVRSTSRTGRAGPHFV
eukprot:scaffold122982_cov22-Tisochrysis_lutea.AAC.3